MSDEYLWDRTGEPDAEVSRLESLLAVYRYAPPRARRYRLPVRLAVAASLVLVASALFFALRGRSSEWQIAGKTLAIGQTVETGDIVGVKLESRSAGQIRLEPNSQLRIMSRRLALRRGTMHALIWAPPAQFVVETPFARTVDLGCAYTLSVLGDDSGLLTVQTGWVAFEAGRIESFIPAGAACRTRPLLGPGVPWFEDASEAFRDAVAQLDRTGGHMGLNAVLANARPRDGLTLWHLALRTSGRDRDLIARRLADLVPGVDVAGLNAREPLAIDNAWNLLGLGGAEWWRTWKHRWSAE